MMFPSPGDTVKFTGSSNAQTTYGGWDDPNDCLLLNSLYVVESVCVESWKTSIVLETIKEKRFNCVCFDVVSTGESQDFDTTRV